MPPINRFPLPLSSHQRPPTPSVMTQRRAEPEEIRATIEEFLTFVDAPPSHPTQLERGLMQRLDRLALLVSELDPQTLEAADFESDMERLPHERVKKYVDERFAVLGFYSTFKPGEDENGQPKTALGDAVEDLTDLLLDLSEVVQIFKRYGTAAGLIQFYELYWVNWGRDLRDLQRLLYDRLQQRHFGD